MKMKSNIQNNNFVISVKDVQNHTWQGTIQWIEGKKEENFRSTLEMIKLIDSAISKDKKK